MCASEKNAGSRRVERCVRYRMSLDRHTHSYEDRSLSVAVNRLQPWPFVDVSRCCAYELVVVEPGVIGWARKALTHGCVKKPSESASGAWREPKQPRSNMPTGVIVQASYKLHVEIHRTPLWEDSRGIPLLVHSTYNKEGRLAIMRCLKACLSGIDVASVVFCISSCRSQHV